MAKQPSEKAMLRALETVESYDRKAPKVIAVALALDAFAAEAVKAEREACVLACIKAVPRAHTYASENANYYRAGDAARDACIAAIRARGKE